MDRNRNYEEPNRKRKWMLLLLVIFIGVVTGILLSQIKHKKNVKESETFVGEVNGGVELFIDPNAKNPLVQEHENTVEQGIAVAGMETIIVSAGKKDVLVDFYNPEENAGLYYLTFELRLYPNSKSDEETLYNSGLVEPGKHIEEITLSRELEKGVYEAVVHVQPYRMNKEKTLTNNADIKVKLIVE